MRLNLNLTQKGIILVSVPLIFELAFVGLLAGLWWQSEDARDRMAQSRAILADIHELPRCLYEAVTYLMQWRMTRNPVLIGRSDETVKQVKTIFADMDRLAKNNERQQEHVRKLKAYGDTCLYLVDQYKLSIGAEQGGSAIKSPTDFYFQSLRAFQPLVRESKAFEEEETAILKRDPEADLKARALLQVVFIAGLVANIGITVVLSFFFSQGIVKRLAVVSDNSMRLASRAPLREPMPGRDEVANLDKVLHAVADALTKAEQSKQEFVSMIGHDLRSPLMALQVSLSLISKGKYGELSSDGKARVTKGEESLDRLVKLVNDLLDIDRIEAGMLELHLERTSSLQIAKQSIDAIRALAEANSISVIAPTSDFQLVADERRLVQVLVNLLSNAVKFSPDNSEVHISNEEDRGAVLFKVQDQGRGIPPAQKANIFDRFKQVEARDATDYKGTGLGLAICKAIVEKHHGDIGVISEEGKGSTFWFRIPIGQKS